MIKQALDKQDCDKVPRYVILCIEILSAKGVHTV